MLLAKCLRKCPGSVSCNGAGNTPHTTYMYTVFTDAIKTSVHVSAILYSTLCVCFKMCNIVHCKSLCSSAHAEVKNQVHTKFDLSRDLGAIVSGHVVNISQKLEKNSTSLLSMSGSDGSS